MSNILIEILAEFTGKKAFKQADSAAVALTKSAKKLAGTLGVAFSARAVIQYTKAASIAAAQDQRAQQLLAINLKNLGLAYANLDSEKFIANLEKQSGILDDELRPAYAQLARVTGSILTTQKLMNVAFDASSGSGLSYASTIDILSQAYIGNQKGLKQLNLGYTSAELKAKSFNEIVDIITKRFSGAGKTALQGYAGQMAKFNVATSNAAETLGGAFLDSFKKIAGNGDIDQATSKIDKFAEGLAGVIRVLTGVNSLEAMLKDVEWGGFLGLIPKAPKLTGQQSPGERKAIDAAAKKAEQERLKLLRAQAAAQAKILADKKLAAAIDKANLALNKGTNIFDMDAIQLNAALINQAEQLGKVTSQAQLLMITTDIARLRVKQDIAALEDAIASKDAAAIEAATKKLNEDLKILGTLQGQSLKLADIKSILDTLLPKDLINQANLDSALAKIKEMLALLAQMTIDATKKPIVPIVPLIPTGNGRDFSTPAKVAAVTAKLPASVSAADFFASLTQDEKAQLGGFVPFKGANISSAATQPFVPTSVGYGTSGTGRQVPVEANFTFNINAGTIANPDELTGLIQDSIIRINKQGDYLTSAGAL